MERYSFSQLRMFLRCPYQYYLRYIEGLKIPPDGGLTRGSACHSSILSDRDVAKDGLLAAKIKGIPMPLDEVIDTFNDCIERKKDETEWNDEKLSYDDARSSGQKAVQEYYKYAHQVIPEAIEQEIATEIDGVPYLGYIDIVCEGYNADLKFKSRKADVSVTELLQLGIYNLYNNKPFAMIHSVIIRKKDTEVITQNFAKDQLLTDRIRRYNEIFISMKEKEMFPPCNPDSWGCSPDWCGYTRICPYYTGKKGER